MPNLNLSKMYHDFLTDPSRTIQWLKDRGLLRSAMACSQCGNSMKFDKPAGNKHGRFRCKRKRCRYRDKSFSPSLGTWFYNHYISNEKIILLTYAFSRQWTYEEVITQTSLSSETTSSRTVAAFYSYCREVCVIAMQKRHADKGPTGGPGQVVEIDESLIGHRKYHRGRLIPGTWVFGIYNRNTKELRMFQCPNNKRDQKTLLPIIKANIAKGTKIMSDCWASYKCLNKHGYTHETVKHAENFVDPITGAHTQTSECNWRHLKTNMRKGGIPYENKAEHIWTFLYMKMCRKNNIDVFEQLLQDIKTQFPL